MTQRHKVIHLGPIYADASEPTIHRHDIGDVEDAPKVSQSPANHLPKVPFVGAGSNVMCGSENVAVARSRTFANRIANALNQYIPNSKGE